MTVDHQFRQHGRDVPPQRLAERTTGLRRLHGQGGQRRDRLAAGTDSAGVRRGGDAVDELSKSPRSQRDLRGGQQDVPPRVRGVAWGRRIGRSGVLDFEPLAFSLAEPRHPYRRTRGCPTCMASGLSGTSCTRRTSGSHSFMPGWQSPWVRGCLSLSATT